jgi:hypothetical protein
MKDVIDKQVPLSKLALFCVPWWSEEIGELVEEARRALGKHIRNPTELTWLKYHKANRAKGAATRQAKRQCFERAIEIACKEECKSF